MTTPRLTTQNVCRALFVLCVVFGALLLSNVGCSSGAICYRNTDCPAGSVCKDGQCVIRVTILPDAGIAGSESQTPDAN